MPSLGSRSPQKSASFTLIIISLFSRLTFLRSPRECHSCFRSIYMFLLASFTALAHSSALYGPRPSWTIISLRPYTDDALVFSSPPADYVHHPQRIIARHFFPTRFSGASPQSMLAVLICFRCESASHPRFPASSVCASPARVPRTN